MVLADRGPVVDGLVYQSRFHEVRLTLPPKDASHGTFELLATHGLHDGDRRFVGSPEADGDEHPLGRRLLIIGSDNDFDPHEASQFFFFAIGSASDR